MKRIGGELQAPAGCSEVVALPARAVVGHQPRDHGAEALVLGDGGFEKGDGSLSLFIDPGLPEGDALQRGRPKAACRAELCCLFQPWGGL